MILIIKLILYERDKLTAASCFNRKSTIASFKKYDSAVSAISNTKVCSDIHIKMATGHVHAIFTRLSFGLRPQELGGKANLYYRTAHHVYR